MVSTKNRYILAIMAGGAGIVAGCAFLWIALYAYLY